MVDYPQKESYTVDDLRQIVALLRAPGGCPWDREQTHESIRRGFLEETYEAVEAIDEGSLPHLREELGDVLLQVLFHAQIETEKGNFTLDDVADAECRKLIYRHPHVFGNVEVSGVEETLENWDALKKAEHGQKTQTDVLNGVARTLPGLWRAEKLLKKAAKAGFAWPSETKALQKLTEECGEVRLAAEQGQGDLTEELGDLLFAAAAVALQRDIDPEAALHAACEKFLRRFAYVEERCGDLTSAGTQRLLSAWQEAKEREKQNK